MPAQQLTPAEHAESLDIIVSAGMASYATELHGAPADARGIYGGISANVASIQRIGLAGVARDAALEDAETFKSQGLHEASRAKELEAEQIAATATAEISAAADQANVLQQILEASLKASLVPATPADSSRALARQEIERAIGTRTGLSAVAAAMTLVPTASDAVLSELLSSWFERVAAGESVQGQRPVDIFRREAVASLLKLPKNAPLAAQMAALPRLAGMIATARQAANMRLSS